MGRQVEPYCPLRLPALDQFDHFLVACVFELSDTLLFTPVNLLIRFKYAEPLQIDGMALMRLENRSKLVEDNFCVRAAPR
jgi:hypothetical protein